MSPTVNKKKAKAEAKRLLRLVVAPPGSAKLASAPPSLSSPLAAPRGASVIDESGLWQVPMSMNATLDWFTQHPPGGLAQTGSVSGGSGANGYMWNGPPSAAWIYSSLEVAVARAGSNSSVLRADGVIEWIDPVPYRDAAPGRRITVAVAAGCPASVRGIVGVRNPPPPLTSSLLPNGAPTSGLVCKYHGLDGPRGALQQSDQFALNQKTVLDAAAAAAFAVKVRQLPLGHDDGGVRSCPNADLSVTVVALAYPDGRNIDLWTKNMGCSVTSNGYISADGDVPV